MKEGFVMIAGRYKNANEVTTDELYAEIDELRTMYLREQDKRHEAECNNKVLKWMLFAMQLIVAVTALICALL